MQTLTNTIYWLGEGMSNVVSQYVTIYGWLNVLSGKRERKRERERRERETKIWVSGWMNVCACVCVCVCACVCVRDHESLGQEQTFARMGQWKRENNEMKNK